MNVNELSDGVFEVKKRGKKYLATRNADPGHSVYGEHLIEVEGGEYRIWEARRSKIAAMVLKKFFLPFKADSKVLYLGAASGTTVSHVSDILDRGIIYAVEFSPRPMRDLIQLCQRRNNIIPLLSDAGRPLSYTGIVEPVDIIFQDVAQPAQARIAAKNAKLFLRDNGYIILSIKARSVDAVANPDTVFKNEVKKLEESLGPGFEIIKKQELSPFHEDHLGLIARVKRLHHNN